jgi:hypothetical protein
MSNWIALSPSQHAGKHYHPRQGYSFATGQQVIPILLAELSKLMIERLGTGTLDFFFASCPKIRKSDRTPIFVVGMPRSGTTLTEQILCSHPDIFGARKPDLMARLTQLMPKVLKTKTPYPKCLEGFTPHLREEAARFYLKGLQNYDTEHSFVVDKMPHNFMQLGLISLIFPKAKIIHINRDPRDTAVSNFQQNFKAKHGGLGYAFNLKKTALQIND